MSQWKRRDPLDRDPPEGRASSLHRAMGLGSAKSGAHHWWLQRATAAALVPLSVWFLAELIAQMAKGHVAAAAWLGKPFVAIPMILLLVAMFQHLRLGLQVIIEDYVHSDRIKFAAVAAVHGACYTLMATGILAMIALR
ncbi:succinate dehydrogenase, hydrophobic membrane anchor protein [Rhodanobacter terrae]|uniref:Succinate dehydrogenase hydrophobic membrane anchor subunit n=1 Tax=Rhodanobacter terrae TaxID=418647 RepID=A0ABW0T2X4_9GAMM